MQCRWARQRCQPDRFGDLREGDDVGQWAAPPHHEMNTASRILGTVDAVPCTAHNASSCGRGIARSEEHTSELQSLMRISYAVFCLKKKKNKKQAREKIIKQIKIIVIKNKTIRLQQKIEN